MLWSILRNYKQICILAKGPKTVRNTAVQGQTNNGVNKEVII